MNLISMLALLVFWATNSEAIINGTNSQRKLFYVQVWANGWSCGGTIIGKFWVLTSLKCVESVSIADAVHVIVGEFEERESSWKRNYNISHIFKNKPVALLKSRKHFHHSHSQILHLCNRERPEDSIVSTCGMGRISNNYSPGVPHTFATYLQETHYYLKPGSHCVGTLSLHSISLEGSSLCMGDQGGPLYTWNFGKMAPDCLYGVAMAWRGRRDRGRDCTQPNFFEPVFDFRHWIEKTIKWNVYLA